MSQTNTPFNSGNDNADFGVDQQKLKALNTPEMINKSIGYVVRLGKVKLSKKYKKKKNNSKKLL